MGNRAEPTISRIRRLPLRSVWPHEAYDFTRWLAENLDHLEEVTGLRLELEEREAATGDFAVDILATDAAGNLVVIENQLDRTDHDHLGKLLTYVSNHEAKAAIWITSQPRPEHEKAIQWLNEFLPADVAFYLVQVEAIQIEDSPPAPLFTVIAGPSPESRRIGEQRKELAERHLLRLAFWEQLLERATARDPHHPHARVSPSKDNWIAAGAGKSGLTWAYVVRMDDARVELYIDSSDAQRNEAIFDALAQKREAIEAAFGGSLDWQRLEGRRAARICAHITEHGGLRDRERWPELQERMIDTLLRLERTLKPHLRRLR